MKKILFLLTLLINFVSFSKNLVLTNNQVTYTITSSLTKDTNIEVKDLFGIDKSMGSDQIKAFKDIDMSKYKEANAVVDLQKVWSKDTLFENVRRENIKVVEIDASYSYQDNSSLALLILEKDNDSNPFVWLNLHNLQKMFKIVAADLSRLFPSEAKKINTNLNNALKELDYLVDEYNKINNIDGLIVLSDSLDYLVSFLNVYNYKMNYNDVKLENIKDILQNTGLNTFVTEKPLKKEIKAEIEKNGAKVLVLKTGSFPEENENEELAKDGLFTIIKENLENLRK